MKRVSNTLKKFSPSFLVLTVCLGFFSQALGILGHDIDIANAANKENIVPILIIGSGPAGLCAAIYGVRGNIKVLVVHGPLPGGLLTQTTEVENWPGSSSILGQDIIQNLQDQAGQLADKYLKRSAKDDVSKIEYLQDTIAKIDASAWPFKVYTDDGIVLHALSIIIATGASPKKLYVPGEHLAGVTSCARCDAPFYEGKDVVVVGGGDTAVEEAMQLAHYAKSIKVLVRKDEMRASAIMKSRLAEYPSVSIEYNVEVKEILGDQESGVVAVKLTHTKNNTRSISIMPVQGVFLAVGHTANSDLVKDIVDIDEQGVIQLQGRSQATSMPGIFAAGDVADKLYRQAGTAGGYGIGAGIDAINFLTHIGYTPSMAVQLEQNMFRGMKAE
ncbi:MAG: FAD-dependent oxidoreductase [Candidatus Babeliales bacterium]|nr:FAD-dependent oxidoreductase [Candidatus Babeliales bacterium]